MVAWVYVLFGESEMWPTHQSLSRSATPRFVRDSFPAKEAFFKDYWFCVREAVTVLKPSIDREGGAVQRRCRTRRRMSWIVCGESFRNRENRKVPLFNIPYYSIKEKKCQGVWAKTWKILLISSDFLFISERNKETLPEKWTNIDKRGGGDVL